MENTEIQAVENTVEEIAEEAVEVATKHQNGSIKYAAIGAAATLVVIGVVKYGKRAVKWIGSKVKKSKNNSEVIDNESTDEEG